MTTPEEVRAGAVALARQIAPRTQFASWSEPAQDRFQADAEACLAAAEKARKP